MRVLSLCAILLMGTVAQAAPGAPIEVCARGPEATSAAAAVRELTALVQAAATTPPPAGKLRAALDKATQLPCLRLAAESGRALEALDDTEAFVDWWNRGGAYWLQSLLEAERVVVPPEPRQAVGAKDAETPIDAALKSLLCNRADAGCGRETEGWRARAEAALEAFDLQRKERDGLVQPRKAPRDPGVECAEATRTIPPERRYSEWRSCLDDKVERREVMPLGRVRAPTRGWLVLRGRRGHYDFCETLSAYDLATGAAYQTRSCSSLQLRSDGSVDGTATRQLARSSQRRGRVSIDNLRETLYAILLGRQGQYLKVEATTFTLPHGMKRRWVGGDTSRSYFGRGLSTSSAQTVLDWAWIDGGKLLGRGDLTWPASLSYALEAHAAALLYVAEEGLLEGCPPVALPPDLPLLMPREHLGRPVDNAKDFADLAGAPCKR